MKYAKVGMTTASMMIPMITADTRRFALLLFMLNIIFLFPAILPKTLVPWDYLCHGKHISLKGYYI